MRSKRLKAVEEVVRNTNTAKQIAKKQMRTGGDKVHADRALHVFAKENILVCLTTTGIFKQKKIWDAGGGGGKEDKSRNKTPLTLKSPKTMKTKGLPRWVLAVGGLFIVGRGMPDGGANSIHKTVRGWGYISWEKT